MEPPRPLKPAIVKVVSGRSCGLLRCVVQELVAHAELRTRNCSQPLKVPQSFHRGPALNLVLSPKTTGAHQAMAPAMKGHVRVPWTGEPKHWASVVQDQAAALSLWPMVPEGD